MVFFPQIDGVVFDCDSTLTDIEGIDELAIAKNCGDEVIALTNRAMNGEIPLEEVYEARLKRINPHQKDIEQLGKTYCKHLLKGAKALIDALKEKNIAICIVSGGIQQAVEKLSTPLGIEEIYAVALRFNEDGSYQGIIPSPLTTAQGKADIIAKWRKKHQLKNILIIGDGMSDLFGKREDAARWLLGFGGVIEREAVKAQADQYTTEKNLYNLLKYFP